MELDLSQSKNVIFFVLGLSILSIIVVKIESYILAPFAATTYYPYLDALGFIGSYTLMFTLFNNYLWKMPLFRWLKIVDFPILSGRWEGQLASSYKNTVKKSCIEIKQSFLGISVYLYSEQSCSQSIMATLIRKENDTYELHYEYRNDPNENATRTMNSHLGMVALRYNSRKKQLEGYYFNENNHGRGHTGKLTYKWKSNKLQGQFI